jgi:signal transduction histidine kinase
MRSYELALVTCALAVTTPAFAATQPLTVTPSLGHVDLFGSLEVLEDPTAALSIADAAAPALASRYAPPTGGRRIGFNRSAWFVRVRLRNAAPEPTVLYLEPYRRVDDITLYRARPDGSFDALPSGRLFSIGERPVHAPVLFLPFRLAGNEETTLYLRLRSSNNVRLNLELYGDAALHTRLLRDWLVLGLFYGAVLALLLYNLSLFVSIGDPVYLYYTIFELGFLLWQGVNDDIVHTLFWPHSPRLRIASEGLFAATTIIGALGFVKTFLEFAKYSPRGMQREATMAQLVAAATIVCLPWVAETPTYQKLALLWCTTAAILTIRMGIRAWRLGSPNAPFFLAGWTALCIAAGTGALVPLGLADGARLVDVGGKLGGVTEALVLSLGLAARVQRIRRDKDRIAAELIANREKQAAELEAEVAVRTRELAAALDKVQRTQSQLVQQARLASLGHLVAGVAHEVGNPLNFTRGGAFELQKKLELIDAALAIDGSNVAAARVALDDARRATTLVVSGSERIRRIVEHLRDYSAARPIALEPTDVVASVAETLAMMSQRIESQAVQVVRELLPTPPVLCRAGELSQVIMNLVLNSCQAMPDGGELRIASRVRDGHVEISVSDTGPGVPPEVADAIFDPFFTTRPPSEGTGLGLSISHEIVRRLGGELELVAGGRGATFVIRLPIPPED